MTGVASWLEGITDQDMKNPIIANLVKQMYDPSDYSDAVEHTAAKQVNDCLMAMVEEEKVKQFSPSCELTDSGQMSGVDAGADLPNSPDCDLFNSISIIEIQKDKKVAVCDLTSADAGQKGRGQLDNKEVALSCEMPAQGSGYGDSKEVASAGNGNTDGESKQVASPHTTPVASPRAIFGDVVWMQVQLWDNSDKPRCVKYYSKYDIKKYSPSGKFHTHTLYLNFTSHRSFVKNYKAILTYRQEWGKPVEQFYDKWRKRSIEEEKATTATRPPLIGIAMSDPKRLSSIEYVDGKSRLRVTTKYGKEVRNDYWPGYVGILFWDEYDTPHIWLGIHGRGEMLFPLIDGKHTADWEPKTDVQRRTGRRPCDFIGYWHQDKAEEELLLEKVRRLKRKKI